LQSSWGEKGLTIVGVTSEGEADTVKWVESKGAKYAYGYDKSKKLSSYFGISGIPAAVLIDAKGVVVWQGHPGSLPETALAKACEGALPKPLWEWAPATKTVKAALLKRQYKTALDEAGKLTEADGGPQILSAIQQVIGGRVSGLEDAYSKGDYLGTETAGAALVKELAGLPEKDKVDAVLAKLAANKEAGPLLKAQKQVAKIRAAELSKRKEREAAVEDLAKIEKQFPGTFVASEAADLAKAIKARK